MKTSVPPGALRRHCDVLPFFAAAFRELRSCRTTQGIFRPLGDGYPTNTFVRDALELAVCRRVVNL